MVRTVVVAVTLAGFFSTQVVGMDDRRASISQKGSLLVFPAIEIEWNNSGEVVVDTFISLTNDYFEDVRVKAYFVNGDEALDALYAGSPPTLVRDAEPGWNSADCAFTLTQNQPVYWSAAFGGQGVGCQPFTVIDPNGRPNLEGSENSRILRGFMLLWAVDGFGREIRWNHLSGLVTTVDYRLIQAWEYPPYAFRVHSADHGQPSDERPGVLMLNGREYDVAFDALVFDFEPSGTTRIINNSFVLSSDSDLTLLLLEADFREPSFPLVTTRARYDIWNMNERRFSGTQHPVTCWYQRLFSRFDAPDNLMRQNLQTDRGKARVNGITGEVCDDPNHLPAPLLGVLRQSLIFSASTGFASVASALVGQGCESGAILYDIPSPPGSVEEPETPGIGPDRAEPLKSGRSIRAPRGERVSE